MPKNSHLVGVQGIGEQRTKQYTVSTAREQAEPVTPQSAKSLSGVASSAGGQAAAVRSF